jgi:hypothetical protein
MIETLTVATPEKEGPLPLANPTPPAPPNSIAELAIPESMVFDITLRFLREHGATTLTHLQKSLKVSHSVATAIFDDLRQRQLIEILRTLGNDYLFVLTREAMRLAAEKSETCRYAGPLPVPLSHYARVVESQRATVLPTREMIRKSLGELVVPDRTVDQLGAVFASRRPVLLYGPTGSGKTSIVERLPSIHADSILAPYAVEVDAHIVQVFDPLVHYPVQCALGKKIDQRWVSCLRPCLVAGGELVASMLNLRLDEYSGVYSAPVQMKANNGTLFIDDFGRQAMPPRELLNRWIVPLDRRVDYLFLQYGFTFRIPFESMLVFATNLDPSELGDEAFLRRLPNKILIGSATPEMFDEIVRRVLRRHDLAAGPELVAYFQDLCNRRAASGLRSCYPIDIMGILVAMAAYQRRPVEVTRQNLDAAAETYFAQSPGAGGSPAT